MFEMLTKAQGEHALPHVPRMVAALARRFKDPDSNVADACVDAMGTLAEYTLSCRPGLDLGGPSGNGKPIVAGPEALGRDFAAGGPLRLRTRLRNGNEYSHEKQSHTKHTSTTKQRDIQPNH